MDQGGTAYTGFLYAGLVLTEDGPQVLEFNCRLGDPEAQVVPPAGGRPGRRDAGRAGGRLPETLQWSPGAAVDVVLASAGYPEDPATGEPITGTDSLAGLDDVLVFHAATAGDAKRPVTAGGRVLNVVGLGDDLATARRRLRVGGTGPVPRDAVSHRHRGVAPLAHRPVPCPRHRRGACAGD